MQEQFELEVSKAENNEYLLDSYTKIKELEQKRTKMKMEKRGLIKRISK